MQRCDAAKHGQDVRLLLQEGPDLTRRLANARTRARPRGPENSTDKAAFAQIGASAASFSHSSRDAKPRSPTQHWRNPGEIYLHAHKFISYPSVMGIVSEVNSCQWATSLSAPGALSRLRSKGDLDANVTSRLTWSCFISVDFGTVGIVPVPVAAEAAGALVAEGVAPSTRKVRTAYWSC